MNRDAAIWAGIAAALVVMVVSFVVSDSNEIRSRLRALERLQHTHSQMGAPKYPPHWRAP